MSFVRFGSDGSQVYLYDDIDLGPTCCFCGLAKVTYDEDDNPHWEDFSSRDLAAMLRHLVDHRAAGHVVPEWVDQVLRDALQEMTNVLERP